MRSISLLLLSSLLGLLVGCNGDDEEPTGPDHTAQFEEKDHAKVYADVAFDAEVVTQFRTQDVLNDLEVRSLLVAGNDVYAGTARGLFRLDTQGSTFEEVTLLGGSPVIDLAPFGPDVVAARTDRLHLVPASGGTPDPWMLVSTSSEAVSAIAPVDDLVFVGTNLGLLTMDRNGRTATVTAARGFAVKDLLAVSAVVWIATDQGVLRYDSAQDRLLSPILAPTHLPDDEVRALALSDDGAEVIVGTTTGLARITADGASSTLVTPGLGGLPNADVRAVAHANGVVFSGHAIGATAMAAEKIDHYHSLRWIPDQRVNAVAIASDGTRWIGTPAGISRITFESTTLTERAATNEALLDERHWRMDGFVDDRIRYDDPWDLTSPITGDHDNDGLWTEMQIGTWCYAYAVTKDEKFYQRARRAMDVMFMQIDIPAIAFQNAGLNPGFVTRSLVRDDEGSVFTSKETQSNWHLQEYEGRSYYWKDDTSSDEYAGHYFGMPIYYDLCAKDEAEKEELRKRVRLSTDYIIDSNYYLIDLDGEKTTHGHWRDLAMAVDGLDPCTEKFGIERAADCISSRHGGGWLNSVEILGQLLAVWHMTGDQKYYDEYERLYTDERYGEMIKIIDDTFTVTEPAFANHSDHELAMLGYITYLRYEPHPDRRSQAEQSLVDFYEYEREEHNPWQIAVIGSIRSEDVDLDGAIQTLKDMPLDWRTWLVDNDHREDADRWRSGRHGEAQFSRVFPYDEIRTMKWNGSPYAVTGGGDGRGVLSPTPYLIAYWMLRYYGMLEAQ